MEIRNNHHLVNFRDSYIWLNTLRVSIVQLIYKQLPELSSKGNFTHDDGMETAFEKQLEYELELFSKFENNHYIHSLLTKLQFSYKKEGNHNILNVPQLQFVNSFRFWILHPSVLDWVFPVFCRFSVLLLLSQVRKFTLKTILNILMFLIKMKLYFKPNKSLLMNFSRR